VSRIARGCRPRRTQPASRARVRNRSATYPAAWSRRTVQSRQGRMASRPVAGGRTSTPAPVDQSAPSAVSSHRRLRWELTADTTLCWEYPRATPGGDQTDLVEVMDLDGPLIRHHRIYWGWHAVPLLAAR